MNKAVSILLASVVAIGAICSSTSPAKAEKVLEGQVCEVNVHKLTTQIDWYKNLHKAEKAAAEQGKLIVWIHMVGKIDGAT